MFSYLFSFVFVLPINWKQEQNCTNIIHESMVSDQASVVCVACVYPKLDSHRHKVQFHTQKTAKTPKSDGIWMIIKKKSA